MNNAKIADMKEYEYIDIDKLDEYLSPEREEQYMQYLANKYREEIDKHRNIKLKKAIKSKDIDYLNFIYMNVATRKLLLMLLKKIIDKIIKHIQSKIYIDKNDSSIKQKKD